MARLRTGDVVTTKKGYIYARVTYMGEDGKRHALWRTAKNRTDAKRICRQLIREMGDVPGIMKARSGRGFIYALRMTVPGLPVNAWPIKIGYAYDVASRTKDISVGAPYPSTVIGKWTTSRYDREEQKLHAQFSDHRLRGEWFSPAPELLELIATKTKEYHSQLKQETGEIEAII